METIDPVDGWTVNRIEAVQMGETVRYHDVGRRTWSLEPIGETFTEIHRDDEQIELRDSQQRRVVFDLRTSSISSDFGMGDQLWGAGDISRAEAVVNGWLAARIQFRTGRSHGWFRHLGGSRWEEFGADGSIPRFRFEEVERSERSVVIRDASRRITLTFDLTDMQSHYQFDDHASQRLYPLLAVGMVGPPSGASHQVAQLTIENPTSLAIETRWVDFLGNERTRFTIDPGATRTVTTYVGHRWVMRDAESRRRLASLVVQTPATRKVLDTDDLRPIGGEPVDVTVKNLHTEDVELLSVGADGSTATPVTIEPGGHASFRPAHAGDVWRYRSEGVESGVVLAGLGGHQYRRITRGPSRSPDATIRFVNATPLEVAVRLVDEHRATRFHTMAPGEEVEQPVVSGERWVVHDAASDRLLLAIDAPTTDETVVVTTVALRSRRGDQLAEAADDRSTRTRLVRRTFRNDSTLDVTLHAVAPSGSEDRGITIAPGRTVTVTGPTRTVWRGRERTSGREVALHIADRDDTAEPVDVDISARSRQSRTPLTLAVENRTMLHAEVLWIDGDGREQSEGFIAPWGRRTYRTFATHVWVLREPVTRTVLDVHVAAPTRTTMLLDSTDLARVRTDVEVEFGFHNRLAFACEVVDAADPSGPALASVASGDDDTITAQAGQTLAFREPMRRTIFATSTCTSEPTQFVTLDPVGSTHGIPTTIVIDNTSTVDIHAYEHRNGVVVSSESVPPWSERSFTTEAGAMWLLCERTSGVVYSCVMATGTTRRVDIDVDLVRSRPGQTEVDATFVNNSGTDVDAQAMRPDGSWTPLGTIRAGETMRRTSSFSEVTRFVRANTELEFDRSVTSDESPFHFSIENHLVARSVPETGPRRGEVALYPEPDHRGTPTVIHCDIDDLAHVGVTTVGSLQVGPATAVLASRPTGGDGDPIDDVFHVDAPSLVGTDVASGFSRLELFATSPSERFADRISVDLITATRVGPAGELVDFASYRTVLGFDDRVDEVEVWATEPIEVYRGDRIHRLQTAVPTVFTLTSAGTLTLDVPAEQHDETGSSRTVIGSPALMIRTNAMPRMQRFFVHPDRAAMQRLSDQPDEALWRDVVEPGAGSSSPRLTADSCAHAMRALRQVAAAAPGNQRADGRLASPDARAMEYDAWAISRPSPHEARFAPLTVEEAAAVPLGVQTPAHLEGPQFFAALAGALRDFDRVVIRPVASETQRVMTAIDRAADDIVTSVEAVGTAIDREIAQPVLNIVEDEIIAPVVAAVDDAIEAVGHALDDAGELIDRAVDDAAAAVDGVGEILLALTVEVGTGIATLIIDTAEKVAATVTAIVEEIGVAVADVIDFLATVLDWNAIKGTHRLIMGLVPQLRARLTEPDGLLDRVGTMFDEDLPSLRSGASTLLERVGDDLGAIAPADGGSAPRVELPELPSPDWLIDRLVGWFDTGTSTADALPPSLVTRLQELEGALAGADGLGSAGSAAAGRLIAGIEGLLGAPPEQVGPRLLGLAVAVLDDVMTLALDAVGGAAGALIAALRDVVDDVFDLLSVAELPVPLLSDLYEEHVSDGAPMTPLGLAALCLAFPTSVIGRTMVGERWPVADYRLTAADREIFRRCVAAGAHAFQAVTEPCIRTVPDPAPVRSALLAMDLLPATLLLITDIADAIPSAWTPSSDDADDDPGTFVLFTQGTALVTGVVAYVCSASSALLTFAAPPKRSRSRRRRRRGSVRRLRRTDLAKRWDTVAGPLGLYSSVVGLTGSISAASASPDGSSANGIWYGSVRTYLDVGATVGSIDGPVSVQNFVCTTGHLASSGVLVAGIDEG